MFFSVLLWIALAARSVITALITAIANFTFTCSEPKSRKKHRHQSTHPSHPCTPPHTAVYCVNDKCYSIPGCWLHIHIDHNQLIHHYPDQDDPEHSLPPNTPSSFPRSGYRFSELQPTSEAVREPCPSTRRKTSVPNRRCLKTFTGEYWATKGKTCPEVGEECRETKRKGNYGKNFSWNDWLIYSSFLTTGSCF